MKRALIYPMLLGYAVAVYACSKSNGGGSAAPAEPTEVPTEEVDSSTATAEDSAVADTGPAPGSEDPTGNPILLGPPKTVRTFMPPGGQPLFVDGPQWSATRNALYVSLPFATNLNGGKGILTSFKGDGTNYTEHRAGDKLLTGVVGNSTDKDGQLISAELKSVTRTDPATGAVTVIATGYVLGAVPEPSEAGTEASGIIPFAAPNDLVALDDGTIFLTDPGYGVDPWPVTGHLFKIAPGGSVATIAQTYDNNPSPNGIALSRDQNTLFVSFTAPAAAPPFVRRYTINADRSLTDLGKILEVPMDSTPDGLATDADDNLYIAMKAGIAVYKTTGSAAEPYGGPTAKIPQTAVPGEPSGLAFGGPDGKSLYVTTKAGKALELRTKVPGLPH